jgi:hypothetical protein
VALGKIAWLVAIGYSGIPSRQYTPSTTESSTGMIVSTEEKR